PGASGRRRRATSGDRARALSSRSVGRLFSLPNPITSQVATRDAPGDFFFWALLRGIVARACPAGPAETSGRHFLVPRATDAAAIRPRIRLYKARIASQDSS